MNDDEARRERERHGQEGPLDRLQRERVGVEGDPVPDHEYGDRGHEHPDVAPDGAGSGVSPSVREAARRLADPPLSSGRRPEGQVLTERQALAYVLRDVEDIPREATAEMMGVSTSNLDGLLGRARRNLEQAEATLAVRDELQRDDE